MRRKPKRATSRAVRAAKAKAFTDLFARVTFLEAQQRGAALYRRALLKVRDAEDALRAAQSELRAAGETFLRPYEQRITVRTYNPSTAGSAGTSAASTVEWIHD